MAETKRGVAVVVGVGPGLGGALARRFAQGYDVALVARSAGVIDEIARELNAGGARSLAIQSDATQPEEVNRAHEKIKDGLGAPEILIYNPGGGYRGRLTETTYEQFEATWRIHALGAFLWARHVVPDMLTRQKGVILITGATAGVKPFPTSAAFGPAKFAARGLAQVLSRDLHPQGIHVAYVNIDGAIDTPRVRERIRDLKEADLLKPSAIAESYWQLAHQHPSAWSHELDLRPFKEKF